jgi:hypothetical protein
MSSVCSAAISCYLEPWSHRVAVLVEANSVIIRTQAIRERYTGGWNEFAEAVPNGTLCTDDDVARVGFMNPDDCESYVASLERRGLTFLRDGQSQDIAVAIQTDGIIVPCDWLEFGRIDVAPGQTVATVRLKGTASRQVHCPENWRYEKSLSRQFAVLPPEQVDKSLTFLRHENGLDVYRNALTRQEVYIGRPDIETK